MTTTETTFIEQDLLKDEKIVYVSRASKLAFCTPLNLLFFYLSVGIYLYVCYLKWKNSEFVITNKRVIFKKGIFAKATEEHFFNKIETVRVNQSFFGSIFNYGDVIIIGSGGTSTKMEALTDPFTFKQLLLEAMDNQNS